MSSGLYLTDMAAVLRAAGLIVLEDDGWQFRARAAGGYGPGCPTHVMVHHTASSPSSDGQPDVDYICRGSDIAPVSNLYLARDGRVWCCAAGCTNTNGTGCDTWGGGVPDDCMNSYAIGVEAANNGVGEPWPAVQQEAYVRLVVALCEHYRIPTHHVRGHAEYAPSRKIDPAGESRWAKGAATWDMDGFRADLWTQPPLELEGDTMTYYRDDRVDGWQIWAVAVDGRGCAWTCPIEDLPDGGKWDVVSPIVGEPATVAFGALCGLMDRQNRPG